MSIPLYALLVGVNKYLVEFIPTLKGCRNDVELMASVLRNRFEIAEDHLKILVDEQATHEGIKQTFRDHMIGAAKAAKDAGQPIPAFLFHFSGHGSMAVNASGTKVTGVDETIVPHDSRQAGILDIKDWELGQLIDELAEYTQNITVVLDCCHSGSGTRDTEMVTRQCPPDLRPQPQRPPAFAAGTRDASSETLKPLRHVLLAACSNDQSANEYLDDRTEEKKCYGALSYSLAEELGKTPSENATYREIHQRVCRRLWQWYPLQSPQCEGERDRVLFDGTRPPRDLWISVTGKQDDRIKIDAGAVHGMSEGVELAVYPENLRQVTAESVPLARLQVSQRDAVSSWCKVIEGGPEIAIGSRVQMTTYSSQLVRSVSLAKANPLTRAALEQLLTQPSVSGSVQVTLDSLADLHVMADAAGDSLCDAAGVPLESSTATRSVDALDTSIRKWAKYLNAQRIENPAPQSKLRGQIGIEIKLGNGTAISDSSQAILEAGEAGVDMEVVLTNRSADPLYFSLLNFGYDGSIAMLWPADGERIPVPGGKSITIKDLQLSFPAADSRIQVRESLKLFATRTATDFDSLTMNGAGQSAGTRSVPGVGPLGQLLEQAAHGGGTRLIRPKETRVEEDWTTAEFSYQLVRPAKELERPITGGQSVTLPGSGCIVTAPSAFVGIVRAVTNTPAHRSVGANPNPNTEGAFTLGATAAAPPTMRLTGLLGPSGQLMESFEIEADNLARAQLSFSAPLKVQHSPAQRSLTESVASERILVIASDGELLYPVGFSESDSDTVDVTWLPPAETPTLEGLGTRSVASAVRLYVYKMIGWESGSLGLQRVRWVSQELSATTPIEVGERVRHFASGEVRTRRVNAGEVQPESQVLVLVHGGLSDADSMLAEIGPLVEKSGRTYDHILAFEYETIATPLQDSANQLSQSLASVGLSPTGNGRVDLLAIGLGSLVARSAMEMLGAHSRVSRALFAGPPNTGSLLAKSQNIARWLGTLALTKCMLVPQLLPLNLAFNKAVNDAAAVRDLQPNSDFLKALNASSPPSQVPYTILAGVAELPPALAGFVRRLADKTLALVFDDEHDLMYSQTSMRSIRPGLIPTEKWNVHVVTADHFSYWSEPQTVERVVEWLKG